MIKTVIFSCPFECGYVPGRFDDKNGSLVTLRVRTDGAGVPVREILTYGTALCTGPGSGYGLGQRSRLRIIHGEDVKGYVLCRFASDAGELGQA